MDRSRSLLSALRSHLAPSNLPNIWKLLAIIFALLNLKSLPFSWHIRLIYGTLRHLPTSRRRLLHLPGPTPLFAPLITKSRNTLLDCDYNLHKSNSTYFLDSDVGRLQLMIALVGRGVERMRREPGGTLGVHLGGVSANFRREIKPLEGFEVWTRVLAWDGKWLYLVQHFVRVGGVRRRGRGLLQGGKRTWWGGSGEEKGEVRREAGGGGSGSGVGKEEEKSKAPSPHPAIFASIIAKYVFKQGRLTVPPEHVLRAAELLPPKPAGEEVTPPVSMTPPVESTSIDAAATSVAEKIVSNGGVEAMIDASLKAGSGEKETERWDWARVEKERVRGMEIAEVYRRLDALNDEFSGDGADFLGEY